MGDAEIAEKKNNFASRRKSGALPGGGEVGRVTFTKSRSFTLFFREAKKLFSSLCDLCVSHSRASRLCADEKTWSLLPLTVGAQAVELAG